MADYFLEQCRIAFSSPTVVYFSRLTAASLAILVMIKRNASENDTLWLFLMQCTVLCADERICTRLALMISGHMYSKYVRPPKYYTGPIVSASGKTVSFL